MLVATHYESVDNITAKIQDYVKEQLIKQTDILDLDEYSIEDSRLELSSSVKNPVYNSNNAVLGKAEIVLSECLMQGIKQSILDVVPLELRQEFKYENRVTDKERTLLLRKNLTIVSLIQEIQDNIEGKVAENIEDDIEILEENIEEQSVEEFTQNKDTLASGINSNFTEIQDVSLFDEGEDTDTIQNSDVFELDEFNLDDDTEDFELDNDTEEFELDNDTEDLNDDIEEFNIDNDTLGDLDVYNEQEDLEQDDNEMDEVEQEDFEQDNEDIEGNVVDNFDLDKDNQNELVENFKSDYNENQDENVSKASLSELEIFKSIITNNTDNTETVSKTKFKNKTYMDENLDIGLEDLESVSEDEISEDINTDEEDDIFDIDNNDEDIDENFEDDNDDIDADFEDDNEDIDEDFEDDSEEDTDDTLADLNTLDFIEDNDNSTDEFIEKVEDNVEFLDTSNVSMSKPNIDKTKQVPKTELGMLLNEKVNAEKDLHEKQVFLQEFDKQVEQTEDSIKDTVSDFQERIRGETTQARAPAPTVEVEKINKDDLPSLRSYLKKHPYTLIEDLINMGYSNAEIQDGVKRGKFVKKNGMLRALY